MMKKLLSFSLFALFSMTVYCQSADSLELYLIHFQKVAFVSRDTVIEYTRFINPVGRYYFRNGYIEADYYENSWFFGNSDLIPETGTYKLEFVMASDKIDTIINVFGVRQEDTGENLLISLYDELNLSYILKQIGEANGIPPGINFLRLIYPCEDLNFCSKFHVFTIRFNKNSAELYYQSLYSLDRNGFKLMHNDSCLLKKREIENILTLKNNIEKNPDVTCSRPGNPWLLEFNYDSNYKCHIISNYCIRTKNNLRPMRTLSIKILDIANKYFSLNCSDTE